jgi:hypothetical protein
MLSKRRATGKDSVCGVQRKTVSMIHFLETALPTALPFAHRPAPWFLIGAQSKQVCFSGMDCWYRPCFNSKEITIA